MRDARSMIANRIARRIRIHGGETLCLDCHRNVGDHRPWCPVRFLLDLLEVLPL